MSTNGSTSSADWEGLSAKNDYTTTTNERLTKLKPMPLSLPTMTEDRFTNLKSNVSCVIEQATQNPVTESVRQGAFEIFSSGTLSSNKSDGNSVSFPTEGIRNLTFSQESSKWRANMQNSRSSESPSNGLIEETSSQGSSGAGSSGVMQFNNIRNREMSAATPAIFGGRALLMSPYGDLSESTAAPNATFAPTREQKQLDLMNRTGYTIVQRNGQLIYGGPPPNWQGIPPCKGSEIFVGKVPRDIFEDELVPIFDRIGKIYELRLMMDFSGSNRGYFFVRYTCKEDAKRAVRELNNYEIRPNKPLGVIHSVDNRKLWISGIPQNRSPREIQAEMERLTDGVRDVIIYSSQQDKSKSRGYAFVEYESHRAAALARRKLVPGRIFLCGQEIEKVDWAEPENEVDEETMSKVRVLFLRNLMPITNEHQIRHIFNYLSGGQVERVKKAKDFAFVHFATREAAEKAKFQSNDLILDGVRVEVTWSKPPNKTGQIQRKASFSYSSNESPSIHQESFSIRSNLGSEMEMKISPNFQEPPPTLISHRSNGAIMQSGNRFQNGGLRKLVGNHGTSEGSLKKQVPYTTQSIYSDNFLQKLDDLQLQNNPQPNRIPSGNYFNQPQNLNIPYAFYGEAIKSHLLNGNTGHHINQENPYTVLPPTNFMNGVKSLNDLHEPMHSTKYFQSTEYPNRQGNGPAGNMNNCGLAYATQSSFVPPGIVSSINMEQ